MSAMSHYHSPLGWIEIQASFDAVTSLVFCDDPKNDAGNDWIRRDRKSGSEILSKCVSQLNEYFNGQRMVFDIPVSQKGTSFQETVWNVLMDIPFGKTVSYGDVAKTLNNPKSVRAVGAANGQNKVWIIVPCHRVIGANGSLTGYAGGLERKKWLLVHEAQVSGLKFEVSDRKRSTIFKPETSNFKPQI